MTKAFLPCVVPKHGFATCQAGLGTSTRDAKAETMNDPGARKFINNRQGGMPLIYSDEAV